MAALITWLSAAVRRDEEGQGLAEYALILALIAIVVIGAVIFLGGQINTILSNVGTSILLDRSSLRNRRAALPRERRPTFHPATPRPDRPAPHPLVHHTHGPVRSTPSYQS